MPDQEAQTVASIFFRNFLSVFGAARQVHTDQGSNFESSLFKEMCKILSIDKTRCSPQHPSGNGQVERENRSIKLMLSMLVSDSQKDWDQ